MGIFDKLFGKKKEKEERFNIHKLKEKRDIDGLVEVLRENPERSNASKVSPLTRAAISALAQIGDERAIDSLMQVLGWKKIVEKTFHSTEGPSSAYDEKIRFFVSKKLVDEYTYTRIMAAEALAKIGEERGAKYLLQALKNDDFYVRKEAAISLANLGDKRAVKMFIECLGFHAIYIAVIEALGKLKPPEAVDRLIEILRQGSTDKRCAAAEALGKIGDKKAVEPLIMALMEKPIGEKAAKVLRDLGVEEDIIVRGSEFAAKRDIPYLSLREDELGFAYRLAEDALGEIGDKRAVKPLAELVNGILLKDEDYHVRSDAAEALGKIGGESVVEPLIQALDDVYYPIQESAAKALGKIGDKRAVGPLLQFLKDEYPWVRRIGALALGEIGDVRAVEPLMNVLKDEYEEVRESAKDALEKIKAKQS